MREAKQSSIGRGEVQEMEHPIAKQERHHEKRVYLISITAELCLNWQELLHAWDTTLGRDKVQAELLALPTGLLS